MHIDHGRLQTRPHCGTPQQHVEAPIRRRTVGPQQGCQAGRAHSSCRGASSVFCCKILCCTPSERPSCLNTQTGEQVLHASSCTANASHVRKQASAGSPPCCVRDHVSRGHQMTIAALAPPDADRALAYCASRRTTSSPRPSPMAPRSQVRLFILSAWFLRQAGIPKTWSVCPEPVPDDACMYSSACMSSSACIPERARAENRLGEPHTQARHLWFWFCKM